MQREIHALLAAYLADRQREATLVGDLLMALATGSAGRQRMFEQIAAAVSATAPEAAVRAPLSDISTNDFMLAIRELRDARDASVTH